MNGIKKILPRPTPESVRDLAIEGLVASGVDRASIVFDHERFRLTLGERHIFLGNLLAMCRTAWPWQRRATVRRFLASFADAPDRPRSFDEARRHLLPGVRDGFLFEALRLESENAGEQVHPPAGRPLGSRLWLGLFLDSPDSTSVVTVADLREWGVSFEDAIAPALTNLASRSREAMVAVAEGLYHSPWQDCYDPARVLRRETFASLELSGEPVVFAPNWNHLIVTGSGDTGGLATALAFSMKVLAEEPRPMSGLPLVKRSGEWMDFALPKGHPVEPLLRQARVLEMSSVYGDQGPLIEKQLEREGRDVFVAQYNGTQNEQAKTFSSYAVWSKGVPTLLPRTERVFFFDDDGPSDSKVVAQVEWETVLLHCGALLGEAGYTPPRFLVESFPSPRQLEAMIATEAARRDTDEPEERATAD